MRAVASITFDNAFVVHDIKVIEGQSGLFIAMPSRKPLTGNTGISPTQSILRRGKYYKTSYWKNTMTW